MTGERKCHPACLLLPELGEQEYRELVDDMRNQGQRHPIIVDGDGVILDGRHRYRACQELFVEPVVETFHGTEAEKIALVMSENIIRRHLTTAQRAAIAAELSEKLAAAARDRMLAGTPASTDARGKATEQAAKMVGGVSPRSVERAKALMRRDPGAHALAKTGTRKPGRTGDTKPKQARATQEGEPTERPENVDWLQAVRIAVLQARRAGHSEEAVRTAVADVLAPPVTVVDATCWETKQ